MGKIGLLQVDTANMANQALSRFYIGTSSVTVAIATGNPTEIFIEAAVTGPIVLTRARDGKLVGRFTPTGNMNVATFFIDADGQSGDTYVLGGAFTSSKLQAVVRLR